jgi:hypothetical protein
MNIFFWCAAQTAVIGDTLVTFGKTQVPELGAIPYFEARDLFYMQKTRKGAYPTKIRLELETDEGPKLSFTVYTAFGRNLLIDGGNQKISRKKYDALQRNNPVYVPGTIGVTVREDLYREVAQERMILEGRQNQVLRNLLYRLKQKKREWEQFKAMISPLFSLGGLDVPFNIDRDEWLTATYNEGKCNFDLVSAGSGFLQVVNLLTFLFLHTSRVALLDEPDSHMHDDLQRLTFGILNRLSEERTIQLIIATHSPTLIDAAGLGHVLLIDRESPEPLRAKDVDTLVPMLGDRGLALPPTKVINTLKNRRALFVEGKEADFEQFILECGELYKPGFKSRSRGLTVFETGGATKQWPFEAIGCFGNLLGVQLNYLYVSERDFLTDAEVQARIQRAANERQSLAHFERRHRESYLLEPAILAKVLTKKWKTKCPKAPLPDDITVDGIRKYILVEAKKLEDDTNARLLVEHEQQLKGDASHRTEETRKLQQYFRESYTEPLARGEIPYKLLDCKQILKGFRTEVAEKHMISFSDRDILGNFSLEGIPQDLKVVLDRVLALFPDDTNLLKSRDTPVPRLPFKDSE